MESSGFLKDVDIFSDLTRRELSILTASLASRQIAAGTTLFAEGDEGEELFIVESGLLGIHVSLPDGGSMEITEFGRGEFFGEMSIFQNEPRSAGCVAKEESRLLCLTAADFFALADDHPETAIKIMRCMLTVTTNRLRNTNRFLNGMVRFGEEARRRAITDEFTGLYNRGFFDNGLERRAADARVQGHPVSLAMADLDGFGALNARYGEELCNRLISEAAGVFKRVFGPTDILTRYGGDEFAFILPGRDSGEAQGLCDLVCREICAIGICDDTGETIGFSSSIGIATIPEHARNGAELLKKADAALYAAKEAGRSRTACYNGEAG